ncbi:MAG: hypothetical protein ACYCUG_10660 [Acidimicrobiales bacterium]
MSASSSLASTRNPVDVADAGPMDFFTYGRAADLLAASGEVDTILLTGYFGGYSQAGGETRDRQVHAAQTVAEVAARGEVAVVAQSMFASSETAAELRRGGVPVFGDTEAAIAVIARLASLAPQVTAATSPATYLAVEPSSEE